MLIVTGYTTDGLAYAAEVHATKISALRGVVRAPAFVSVLLLAHDGREVDVTPTGPTVTVDINDQVSVVAALHALTRVTRVEATEGEEVPVVIPPPVEDAVY